MASSSPSSSTAAAAEQKLLSSSSVVAAGAASTVTQRRRNEKLSVDIEETTGTSSTTSLTGDRSVGIASSVSSTTDTQIPLQSGISTATGLSPVCSTGGCTTPGIRGAIDFVPKVSVLLRLEEIKQHGPKSSLDKWGIYEGKVYNLSHFVKEIPSAENLLENSGGEFTPLSGSAAKHILENCFVGYIDDGCLKNKKEFEEQGFESPPIYHDRNIITEHLNLNKPLVKQIYNLTKNQYQELATEFICTTEPARFFENSILEMFTRTKWWVIPTIWLPVAIWNTIYISNLYNNNLISVIIYILFGIFIWTLAEYCVHRFMFHFPENILPDIRAIRLIHFLLHAVHHVLPMDPMRLVMPPICLVIIMGPFYIVTTAVLPFAFVRLIWSGVLIGYVCYDLIHYAEHHFPMTQLPLLRFMKKYHLKHHFQYPLLAFGVSSPLWDIVFGTTI